MEDLEDLELAEKMRAERKIFKRLLLDKFVLRLRASSSSQEAKWPCGCYLRDVNFNSSN